MILRVLQSHLTKRVAKVVNNDRCDAPAAPAVIVLRALPACLARDLREMKRLVTVSSVGGKAGSMAMSVAGVSVLFVPVW